LAVGGGRLPIRPWGGAFVGGGVDFTKVPGHWGPASIEKGGSGGVKSYPQLFHSLSTAFPQLLHRLTHSAIHSIHTACPQPTHRLPTTYAQLAHSVCNRLQARTRHAPARPLAVGVLACGRPPARPPARVPTRRRRGGAQGA